jgi:hypothetical protein
MYKKIILTSTLFITLLLGSTQADEGMWLLSLLKKNNAAQMKAMGLKIPIEKIVGEDGALSESVVGFGSSATGSIISGSGLVLTNYHCAYSAIQQYVTPINDIFLNGFWANTQQQELPVNDLVITINKKILDISDEIKLQLKDGNVQKAIGMVSQKYQQKYPGYKVVVKSYQNNSLFVLFLQLQYKDVRLVGVAPKNVTKFGGETDNWIWPRYSADFAFFRVYANKNGAPAAYAKTNVPLVVKNYLHISASGYNKNDFAMSMGYPGLSDRNATSYQIAEKIQILNPPLIAVRKVRQSIWQEEMDNNPLLKQLYAEKFANSANYYKNAVGMNFWVKKLNVVSRKESDEKEWQNWIAKNENKQLSYGTILADLKKEVEDNAPYKRALTYYGECFFSSGVLEFISAFGLSFTNYVENLKQRPSTRQDLTSTAKSYYKGFKIDVDKRVTKAMIKLLIDSLPVNLQPDFFASKKLNSTATIDLYVDEIYKNSVFTDWTKLTEWLNHPMGSINNDPLMELSNAIENKRREVFKVCSLNSNKVSRYATAYSNSLSDFKAGNYYPDADKTIRLSYGTVSDLLLDGKNVPYQTTLNGLIAKTNNTTNPDYFLNKKLQHIWQNKAYGKYGVNGDMPTCFVTNGDVTGGNSGSPMMDAYGKIIGLVFDCNWESMTREFNYEKDLHKVICVDIRYVLLTTEKFSTAARIIDEIEKANHDQK